MIVVGIIGLLAAVAIPNWVRARTTSQVKACVDNLRQIDAATQQWAVETKAAPDAGVVYSDIKDYMKYTVLCPAAGSDYAFDNSYLLTTVGEKPKCKKVPATHLLPLDTTN